MAELSLEPIPPPSQNLIGWPWVAGELCGSSRCRETIATPRITVVTPSFNQGAFLEQTIRSVLLQGYPNLEYIILDGGSTDDSVSIIERYANWISHWESRPDGGQSEAINRGLKSATGEIQCWINSDDYLAPDALRQIATIFAEEPNTRWLTGTATLIDSSGQTSLRRPRILSKSELINWTNHHWFCQQSTFWRTSFMREAGFLDDSLHFTMDWDLWLRFYAMAPPKIVEKPLAYYRFHHDAKCVARSNQLHLETLQLLQRIVDGSAGKLYAAYREEAEVHLGNLMARAYEGIGQRPMLDDFGGFELLWELFRRVKKRFIPRQGDESRR